MTLDKTPPELAADIMEQGIVLDRRRRAAARARAPVLQSETGMPIVVARDPLNCVAIGSGQCLEEFEVSQAGAHHLVAKVSGRSLFVRARSPLSRRERP